jgi:RNA polymerase sigma-70 factor (ECF subfamily)
MASSPETDLLTRCRRGDSAAWDELFDLHYGPAARFIFQLDSAFTREDAEELCQETFLSVIQKIETFHGESQFQTWLFRIAANKARDFRERRQAAKRGGGATPLSLQAEDPETGLSPDPASDAPGPDAQLCGQERARMVHQALGELGEPCREIIELRYFGDLSYEEISSTLQLNAKTVSSRLSKCLDRLEAVMQLLFSGGQNAVFPSNP